MEYRALSKKYTINSQEIEVFYLDWKGVEVILEEIFERDVYRLGELFRSGYKVEFAVDVGAHMGFFGKLLRCYWPNAEVIGFEPQLELVECASRNMGSVVLNFAVRYDGRNDFFVSQYTGGSVIFDGTVNFSEEIPGAYQYRRVLTVPLEIVTRPIDLLKLDCEGSEFDILCGMTAYLRARIRRIVGEYHHLSGYRYVEQIIKLRYKHLTPACHGDPLATIGMFEAI